MIEDLIKKNHSFRRFHQDQSIEYQRLRELVNLARLSASGGNLQPLKYILSCESEKNAKIFLALGRPTEKVVLETTNPAGDIKYYRDSQSIHHVPKRPLDEIIID